MSSKSIGIDLGTTNCCVAAMTNGKAQVLANERGDKTFPSYLHIQEDKVIVGHPAKIQVIANPYQTIFGVKRLIGRSFNSKEVEAAKDYFPYEMKRADDGGILTVAEGREMRPEEVSSYLLKAIKDMAETALGGSVTKAVITVPAYFNSQQRNKTKQAAEAAGLEVLRLLAEPTAAALAYGFRKNLDKRVLVYDLGGGTFDVSILDIGENIFEVVASNGDSYLGGLDFDYLLVDYLIGAFKKREGEALVLDPVGMQRLKDAAEQVKCELSFKNEAQVLLPSITDKANLDVTVKRETLEDLANELIEQTFALIEKTLKEADYKPEDIDDAILVGGQTRMPMLQQKIQEFFGKPALKGVHPDEAVALGAAIHCEQMDVAPEEPSTTSASAADGTSAKPAKKRRPEALLIDVTPLPLGIDAAGDTFSTLIEGNTTIPCSYSRIFTTTRDYQDEVRVVVRQGEDNRASFNTFLGEFVLQGIRQAKKMEPQIEVTFKIDSNGILNVTAKDLDTNMQQSIIINEFELSDEGPTRASDDLFP